MIHITDVSARYYFGGTRTSRFAFDDVTVAGVERVWDIMRNTDLRSEIGPCHMEVEVEYYRSFNTGIVHLRTAARQTLLVVIPYDYRSDTLREYISASVRKIDKSLVWEV